MTAVESYINALKSNLIGELTTIIQQLEKDSFLLTGDVLESLEIKPNHSANKTGPTQMVNKTLDQVLRQHGINFDIKVPLPPILSNQKETITSKILFRTFQSKIDSQKWSELPSKIEFKNSLQVSQWLTSQKRRTVKTLLSFGDKSNYVITIALPHSNNAFENCPVPFVHPLPYSKYINMKNCRMQAAGTMMMQ